MSTNGIGGHVDTKGTEVAVRTRRRRHTDEFKSSVVAQCSVPGVSIAAVALQNGLNANLLRRWVNESGVGKEPTSQRAMTSADMARTVEVGGFVPVKLPAHEANAGTIAIELRRGPVLVKVDWPLTAITECGAWLRELLR